MVLPLAWPASPMIVVLADTHLADAVVLGHSHLPLHEADGEGSAGSNRKVSFELVVLD